MEPKENKRWYKQVKEDKIDRIKKKKEDRFKVNLTEINEINNSHYASLGNT